MSDKNEDVGENGGGGGVGGVEGKPLELDWCCGVNTKLDVIDLTTPDNEYTVAFGANHLVVLQNPLSTNDGHYPLQGHRNNVTALCASPCRRWLASGDYGTNGGSSVIVWDVATRRGIQVLESAHHPSLAHSGVVALSFTADGKTLVVVSGDSIATFWRWTDEEPYLLGELDLQQANKTPSIATHGATVLITYTDRMIFLQTEIKSEQVNIEGEIILRDRIHIDQEHVVPDEDEIGQLKTGWEFGQSKFIADTTSVTYFKRGSGALLLTTRQVIKGVEKWQNLKMVKFSERPVTTLDVYDQDKSKMIVIGDATGHIRFLTSELKLIFWLKETTLSHLCHLSLSACQPEALDAEAAGEESIAIDPEQFAAPAFTALTTSGSIYRVKGQSGPRLMFEGAPEGILKVVAHPADELIIIAGNDQIRIMDTSCSGSFKVRTKLDNETITCLSINKDGNELLVGCQSGAIYILDSFSLRVQHKLIPSDHACVDVLFSAHSNYIAAGDASHAITLWERDEGENNWTDMGRYRPHSDKLIQLIFIDEYGTERLLSLAKDRKLVEYAIEDKLKISSQYRIEADAIPTCLVQYPSGRFEEEFLFTANDRFKLRLFNQSTKLPRRTTNSQQYDSPIQHLLGKPCGTEVVAFVTDTCLGVMQLPIDGNPNREYGVLGNPGGITGSASGQSKIITVGPGLISAWRIDEDALDKYRIRGGLGMAPFYSLLDESEFKLLQDVFYFCQLETEGIETETERSVSRSISIDKVKDAVRALGWFPTELQIEELLTEIKFSKYHKTQEQTTMVDLDDFIKLYLNHRPVQRMGLEEIDHAFSTLAEGGTLSRDELIHALENCGEKMSAKEINECLDRLCGRELFGKLSQIDASLFTSHILRQ